MRSTRSRRWGSQRGNAQVIGLTMLVLLGFGAMSVDIGLVRLAEVQIQTGVEAAALGGSGYLDNTNVGAVAADNMAQVIGNANTWYGGNLTISATDAQVGSFTPLLGFVPIDDPANFPAPQLINAVRVTHTSNPFPAVFAALAFNTPSFTESGAALAVRPSGQATSVNCWLPLAIPDCHVAGLPAETNPPPMEFRFNPSTGDSVAWGDPTGNPSAEGVRDQLSGQCNGGDLDLGDPMYVDEGLKESALLRVMAIMNGLHAVTPSRWPTEELGPIPVQDGVDANLPFPDSAVMTSKYGNVIQGPVALVDAGADCDNVSFTGALTISGFSWAVLYDLRGPSSPQNIWVQLDFAHEHETEGDIGDGEGLGNVQAKGAPTLYPI